MGWEIKTPRFKTLLGCVGARSLGLCAERGRAASHVDDANSQHVLDAGVQVLSLDRTPTVREGRDVGAAHEAEVLLLIVDRHLEHGRDRAVGATAGRVGVEENCNPPTPDG
jgi:predicted metal-dependent RNase